MQSHFCYILQSTTSNRTYVGYTIDPIRRLKQHNGVLAGGAKATKNHEWELLTIVTSPSFTKHVALSFEWHVKHVKKHGVSGRVKALMWTIQHNHKFKDFDFHVWTSQKMMDVENVDIPVNCSLYDDLSDFMHI